MHWRWFMAIYKFTAGSPEWLSFREKYITATNMSALFGLDSYKTASKLFEFKKDPSKEPNANHNPYLRGGKIMESAVLTALNIDLGMSVDSLCPPGDSLVFTDDKHMISSTPDSFYWDPTTPMIVEAKSTSI